MEQAAPGASASRRGRDTLVPSGFECVAHPVFFRNDVSDGSSDYAAPPTSNTAARSAMNSTTTIDPTAAAAWDVEALEGGDDSGRDTDAPGNASIISGRGGREVHSVCPICLGRFEEPVTLTSCLHTFCHTCILGWYEHTVAVALSRGNLSAFHPERGNSNTWRGGSSNDISGSSGTSTGNRDGGRKRPAPVPYRCPLCQVPGPFFLAVERPRSSSFKGKREANPKSSKPSKLKFRLLGAPTVFGGGGPVSRGVAVDEHAGGGRGKGGDGGTAGYPSPSMADLRAAVQTQLALAAAAAAAAASAAAAADRQAGPRPDAEGGSEPSCTGTNGMGVPGGEGMAPETVPGMGMTRGAADGDRNSCGTLVGSGSSSSSSSRHNNNGQSDRSGDRVDSSGGADVGEPLFAAAEPGCEEGGSPMVPSEGGERPSPVPRNRGRDSDWCRSRGRGSKERDRRTEQQGDHGCSGFRNASSSEVRGEPWHASSGNPPHSCSGDEERKKRKRARKEKEKKRRGAIASCRQSNSKPSLHSGGAGLSRGGASCGLPWDPGSMAAEDGLQAIEILLEKEKESLRKKMAGGDCPPL
ncbi:unnamed protein product [Ectocarpus sp. CCAP 1310/34]|nr:unnamed protein product [Ectocarpus sp. CCAP 1310/34]